MYRKLSVLSVARIALTALALLSLSVNAQASEPPKPLSGYRLTSWSRTEGLPPGDIWAIAQDAAGYLWLGTSSGLVRFDGVRFVSSDLLGLPVPRTTVESMLTARDGSLWVGFSRGGISRMKGADITTHTSADDLVIDSVTEFLEDEAGTVFAVAGGRLLRFDGTRWTHSPVSSQPRNGLQGESPDRPINALAAGAQPIARDAQGRTWSIDPVFGFRANDGMNPDADSRPRGRGRGLMVDRRGNIWVNTFGQGLWRVHAEPMQDRLLVEIVNDQTGLSNNRPLSLLEDRDGNIWVGTANGLNRLTPHQFNHIGDLGLVMGLESQNDGHLWAGTADGVIDLVVRDNDLLPEERYLQGSAIHTMHAGRDGTLWAVTDDGVYGITNGQVRRVLAIDAASLPPITGITSDGDKGLWLYARRRGLIHWRAGRLEPQKLPSEFDGAALGSVITDRNGRAWFAFYQNRLAAIDSEGNLTTYGVKDGLDVGNGRSVYEDRSGTIWVVGSQGVARFENDRFIAVRPGDAVLSTLTSVIDGDDDSVWFGSAWGVVRFDRRDFERAPAGQWSNLDYTLLDVSSTARWNGHRNVARTADGRLWFLTTQGVVAINSSAHHESCCTSAVTIDSVVIDGDEMRPTPDLDLKARSRRVEIAFTAPSLTSQTETQFRYRLDGFDQQWINADYRRQATYTNLPPRSYVFRVEASDRAGGNASSTTWAFSVAPAFYQTTWFYGLLAVMMALAVGGIWQLRLRTIHKNFALLLGERVRISRQIHDTLLQSLVGVSLQLDQLGHDIDSTKNGREHVVKLRKLVDEYIRDARQSIWSLRSSMLGTSDLSTALRQNSERITQGSLSFDFKTTGLPRRLPSGADEHLLRVGLEAVTNAVRHSGASHVSMELEYGDRAVTLRVTDDGCGFNPPDSTVDASHEQGESNHWGIAIMRERMAAVGGELHFSSTPQKGTIVEASIPSRALADKRPA